nr:hypothetical protein CFP56_12461 [Quercus suber]
MVIDSNIFLLGFGRTLLSIYDDCLLILREIESNIQTPVSSQPSLGFLLFSSWGWDFVNWVVKALIEC